jgi:hypothetical protein
VTEEQRGKPPDTIASLSFIGTMAIGKRLRVPMVGFPEGLGNFGLQLRLSSLTIAVQISSSRSW